MPMQPNSASTNPYKRPINERLRNISVSVYPPCPMREAQGWDGRINHDAGSPKISAASLR